MTDNQHTPGPWYATPDGLTVYEKDEHGWRASTVCCLPPNGLNPRADALLIAASPAMLAALKAVVACGVLANGDVPSEVEDQINTAIAQATGA